jgi:hypothetical protein
MSLTFIAASLFEDAEPKRRTACGRRAKSPEDRGATRDFGSSATMMPRVRFRQINPALQRNRA